MNDIQYYEQFLDVEWESFDLGKTTFRYYFTHLLRNLLTEGEGFSGKRPFGNSGWDFDMMTGVVQIGLARGGYDREYCEWVISEDHTDVWEHIWGLFEAYTKGVAL